MHFAGEVHLEMCIKDLRERFARIDIHVSAPLVAFRESAFFPSEAPEVVAKPSKVRCPWISSLSCPFQRLTCCLGWICAFDKHIGWHYVLCCFKLCTVKSSRH